MSIPMSALRRALADMALAARAGASTAFHGSHVDRGIAYGGLPGALVGGALGASLDDDGRMATNGAGAGMVAGVLGGAMLGGGAGGVAKLAHMAVRGAGEGAFGFSRGLREALAEQAASRGVGRRAVREAADAGDAAAFAGVDRGLERRLAAFPPRVQELARAIAPIKAEKGSVGWDDLDKIQSELGSITPDELLDLRIIFSDGLSVTRVGHP